MSGARPDRPTLTGEELALDPDSELERAFYARGVDPGFVDESTTRVPPRRRWRRLTAGLAALLTLTLGGALFARHPAGALLQPAVITAAPAPRAAAIEILPPAPRAPAALPNVATAPATAARPAHQRGRTHHARVRTAGKHHHGRRL